MWFLLKNQGRSKGMTLVEVMVALVILGVLTIPLCRLSVAANRVAAAGRMQMQAVNLAQEIIEAAKAAPACREGVVAGVEPQGLTLQPEAAEPAEVYAGSLLAITAGPGEGQIRTITAFDADSRQATLERPWVVLPVVDESSYLVFRTESQPENAEMSIAFDPESELETMTVVVYFQEGGQTRQVSLSAERLRR